MFLLSKFKEDESLSQNNVFNFIINQKIINNNLKVVNLEILKVKTWFGDEDL